ncbi:helix-turn-helix domain-containing protein [Brevundimonas naejangsanensis]|uniref:helix-turn-helix domain-containing protein n=1 Tax=Brevundimonas naejangsanensis TaxID=588932 RepID=UPI0004736B4C|nr:helix-turn-helix transcriptional regulator [Brevundimonas naejangsanensis]
MCRIAATPNDLSVAGVAEDWTRDLSNGYSGFVTIVSAIDKLTPREREILLLVAERLGDKEIAQQLNLSPRTVQNHLHRAYEKLGVSDRQQAARLLSNSYSRQSPPLSSEPFLGSEHGVLAGSERVEDGKTPWPVPFYGSYVGLGRWRRPRTVGGSVLLLILGGALAWILLAAAAISLIPPVLEMIHSLR